MMRVPQREDDCAATGRDARHAIGELCRQAIFCCVAIGAIAPSLPSAAAADEGQATSSRAAREDAIRAIPWRTMTPDDRRRAQFVIQNAGIYRRLPTRIIDCDPDMFTFLVQHPEVIVDVWRIMGISRVSLDKLPDGAFRGTDGAGTTGSVRYLHTSYGPGAQNLAVVYADGAYDGKPFVTPIKAQSVMLLRSNAVQETNGRHYVTVRVDSFVNVQQMGIELVAKTVQPWINKMADQNFIETLSFISNFSRTAEKNPEGMQRLSARLATVDEPTRNELVQLCFRAAERYAHRAGATRAGATLLAHQAEVAVNRAQ
jgi:hypothetical protein